ncbi:hypothetical protein ASPTUDRAFT_706029 [Aspergillus tubingensis CBS 134.48]|uniref:Uncharacterized protein n=1 Tax=Aspergillus tubingensis (strain CBS 134.48) TaxID=767770 RepID=A0A1L9N1T3_ASPTC|nr:hypothetical protein ASPTUDRAFT_706029 [Aspergillus tubingensis CBS 134.48]
MFSGVYVLSNPFYSSLAASIFLFLISNKAWTTLNAKFHQQAQPGEAELTTVEVRCPNTIPLITSIYLA